MPNEQTIHEYLVKGLGSLDKLANTLNKVATQLNTVAAAMNKVNKTKNLNPKYTQTINEAEKSGTKFTESLTKQKGEADKLNQTLTQVAAKENIYKNKKTELTSAGDKLVVSSRKQAGAASVYEAATTKANKSTLATRDSVTSLTKEGYKLTTVTSVAANGQKTISTALNKTKNSLDKGTEATSSYLKSWSFLSRVIAGSLIARGIGQVSSAISKAVTDAREFEIRVSELRTISQQNQLSFESWSQSVRNLSNEFGRAPIDVLEGTYQALSNQIAEGAQTTQFMREALRLSIITTSSTEEAVLGLTGALNAYKLTAEDARALSDKLFKTVELGRIRFKELAGSIGQVLIVSKQLGVSENKILGALSTLTIQGLNATNAQTALRNVLLKLVRPTDAMKELFAEWGVESGEAAIQTFGFVGVIDLLSKAAKKGNSELAELGEFFGRIRAITGGAGLTGSLKLLAESITEIGNATESANKAFEIATESAAFKLNKEIQKIKNNFLELGQELNKTIVNVSDKLGGLANIINTVTDATFALAGAATVATVAFGIGKLTGVIIGLTTAFRASSVAITGFAGAGASAGILTTIGAGLAAVPAATAAGFAALGYLITRSYLKIRSEGEKTFSQLADKYRGEMVDAQLQVTNNYIIELKKQQEASTKTYEQISQNLSQKIAKDQRALNKLTSSQKTRNLSLSVNEQILLKLGNTRIKQETLYQQLLRTRSQIAKALVAQDETAVNQLLQKLFEIKDTYDGLQKKLSPQQQRREKNLNFQQSLGIPVERTPAEFNRYQNQNKFAKTFKDTLNQIYAANKKVLASIPPINESILDGQQDSIKAERLREKSVRTTIQSIKDLQSAITELESKQGILLGNFKADFQELDKQLRKVVVLEPIKTLGKTTVDDIQPILDALKQLDEEINRDQLINRPGFIPDSTWFQTKQQELDALRQKVEQVAPRAFENPNLNAQFDKVQGFLNILNNQSSAIARSQERLNELQEKVKASQDAINALTTEMIELGGAHKAANEFINFTATAQDTLFGSLIKVNPELQRQITLLNQLNALNTSEKTPWTGGYMSRFAGGGSVGSDSINAKLSPGEFVLNRNAARQYFAQATALNSRAARFDTGGTVNNNSNIGDININMSSTGQTQNDARNIAQAVRRELKRGTIRLN